MELERARVRFLLPGIRQGFVISLIPITALAVVLWATDVAGTTAWVIVRVVIAAVLFAVMTRMGDGESDPARTLRRLAVIMFVSSVGWGLLPVLVDVSDVERQAIVLFALIGNIAIVTVTGSADRRVWLAAVLPVSVLGMIGLLLLNADGPDLLPWLLVLMAPYAYAIFATAHRTLNDSFEIALRNQSLVAELERGQVALQALNEQLQGATEQQTLMLDERAALIASVGHDLGSPLGAAMLTAEILADRPDAVPPELHRELARRIHGQVHDAVTVLRDLTSSQRLDEHDIAARRTSIDLRDIVDVVTARHDRAEQSIECRVAPESWMWADPVLIERIVDNLVANAVKYTPPHSRIVIDAEVDRPDGSTVLWVDDDGPGLAEGLQQTMFEPYVRGASLGGTTGSGVGLFLVRSFASLQGGHVWWEPGATGGSRFVVSLPGRDDGVVS